MKVDKYCFSSISAGLVGMMLQLQRSHLLGAVSSSRPLSHHTVLSFDEEVSLPALGRGTVNEPRLPAVDASPKKSDSLE